jgi:S-formylglutathione hydrolase FrmB
MGGHGALYLFAQKPELFRSAGSLSGVVDLNSCPGDYELPEYLGLQHSPDDMAILTAYSVKGNIDKIARAGKEIIFSCGVSDRFYISNNAFRQQCDQLGIKATYISGPGGHDAYYWKSNINSHLEFFAGKIHR